jgi:hypothetical protein
MDGHQVLGLGMKVTLLPRENGMDLVKIFILGGVN